MRRLFLLLLVVALGSIWSPVLLESFQANESEKPPEESASLSDDAQAGEGESGGGLSADEKKLLIEATKRGATKETVAAANEICKDKCAICFDGVACDFDCARDKCSQE